MTTESAILISDTAPRGGLTVDHIIEQGLCYADGEYADRLIDEALLLLSRPVSILMDPNAAAPWDRRLTASSLPGGSCTHTLA